MKPKPLSLCLAVTILISIVPAATGATATDAEREIMSAVNRARADRGLVPLRSDHRLWALADDRAVTMASSGVLSHGDAGLLPGSLSARGIQWYVHAEVIGYSSGSANAAAHLFQLWASSPPHWVALMHDSLNYLGVGLATTSSGVTYGAIILTESLDRTGARASMVRASLSGDDVGWAWRGSDPLLQTHTAGLRDFAVQQRTDSGSWVTVINSTTRTTRTTRSAQNRARGHWYGLRVRARDRAGNVGPWSAELRVWVP